MSFICEQCEVVGGLGDESWTCCSCHRELCLACEPALDVPDDFACTNPPRTCQTYVPPPGQTQPKQPVKTKIKTCQCGEFIRAIKSCGCDVHLICYDCLIAKEHKPNLDEKLDDVIAEIEGTAKT